MHAMIDSTREARKVFLKTLQRTLKVPTSGPGSQSIAPFCEERKPQQARRSLSERADANMRAQKATRKRQRRSEMEGRTGSIFHLSFSFTKVDSSLKWNGRKRSGMF
jgi:hypothetical protein